MQNLAEMILGERKYPNEISTKSVPDSKEKMLIQNYP
jgi:hypothetical protein